MIRQPFHLVEYSPWPLTASIGAFSLAIGIASWFHNHGLWCLYVAFIIIIASIIQWWRDVIREATYLGHHTTYVTKGLRWGIILFITSEVLFFFRIFLSIFPQKSIPYPRTRMRLTPYRHYPPKSIQSTITKYSSASSIRRNSNMGTP